MKNAFKTVSFMLVMVLLSKVLGQVREMMIAAIYGGSTASTAFYAASALPLNLFDIVFASAVTSSFIPVYNTFRETSGIEEGDRFASAFINIVFLGSLILSVLLMIFAPQFISLAAPGLTGEVRELATKLTVIMMPVMIFASLTFSFVGILQSRGEFNIPSVMSLVLNIAMVGYLVFFNEKFGVEGLSVTLVIGWMLQFLLQLPVALKKKFKYQFLLKHEGIKKVCILALPIMVGTWLQPITAIINNAFASGLDNIKAIPSLNYANKLYYIVPSVFTMSITNFIFPRLSRQAVSSSKDEYAKTLNISFKVIILCLVPITFILISLRTPVIEAVYMRGEFGSEDLYWTAGIFMYYSLGILFFGVTDLFNKAFYASKNALIPAVTSGAAIVVSIILSFILKNIMGVFGLALSSSLTALFISVVLFIFLNKEYKFVKRNDILDLVKILLAGVILFLITGFVVKMVKNGSGLYNTLISLIFSAFAGGAAYLALIYILVEDVRGMVKKII